MDELHNEPDIEAKLNYRRIWSMSEKKKPPVVAADLALSQSSKCQNFFKDGDLGESQKKKNCAAEPCKLSVIAAIGR